MSIKRFIRYLTSRKSQHYLRNNLQEQLTRKKTRISQWTATRRKVYIATSYGNLSGCVHPSYQRKLWRGTNPRAASFKAWHGDFPKKPPRGQGMAGIPQEWPCTGSASCGRACRIPGSLGRGAARSGPVSAGLRAGNAARAQLSAGKVNTGAQRNTQGWAPAPQGRQGRSPGSARRGRAVRGRGGSGGGARACRPRSFPRRGQRRPRGGAAASSAPIGCRAAGTRVLTQPALPLAGGAEGAGRGRRSVSEGRGSA